LDGAVRRGGEWPAPAAASWGGAGRSRGRRRRRRPEEAQAGRVAAPPARAASRLCFGLGRGARAGSGVDWRRVKVGTRITAVASALVASTLAVYAFFDLRGGARERRDPPAT